MKVEVNENKQVQEREFPKLMVITANVKNKGMIVFMFKDECGTVLANPKNWDIGHYDECWLMEHFQDFNGSITLSNE